MVIHWLAVLGQDASALPAPFLHLQIKGLHCSDLHTLLSRAPWREGGGVQVLPLPQPKKLHFGPPCQLRYACIACLELKLKKIGDFPGGAVVRSLPANAGGAGLSPGPGRSHMPRSN